MMPSEFAELPLFLEEVQKQHHLDVEYIYYYLQYHRAYTITATALPVSAKTCLWIHKTRSISTSDQSGYKNTSL